MKKSSPYLKMRVLGAIDSAAGRTSQERIENVARLIFTDEQGQPRKFTWRTIATWLYRYKNHGITGVTNRHRRDKGAPRKITPEELLEAINAAKPHFRNSFNSMQIYRFCIENGLLRQEQIAQTTFYRFIREYELLKLGRLWRLTLPFFISFCYNHLSWNIFLALNSEPSFYITATGGNCFSNTAI